MLNMNNEDGNNILKKLLDQLKQEDSVIRIQMNDNRLRILTEYDVTKGHMNIKVTPEQLQSRFTEFKQLVRRGSITLKQLEDDIYSKWGINEEARADIIKKEFGDEEKVITGFNIDDMKIADIPEDSKDNH